MMRKMMAVAALAGGLLLAGCDKNGTTTTACTVADPSTEDAAIVAYNTSHGYGARKDSALGIYYQILAPGTGARPSLNSTVTVTYSGRLLNDVVFDSTSTAAGISFGLSSVIVGWQRTIPLLRVGGSIRMIVPSAYGYGCRAQGSIPANSPLYFDVKLLQVN